MSPSWSCLATSRSLQTPSHDAQSLSNPASCRCAAVPRSSTRPSPSRNRPERLRFPRHRATPQTGASGRPRRADGRCSDRPVAGSPRSPAGAGISHRRPRPAGQRPRRTAGGAARCGHGCERPKAGPAAGVRHRAITPAQVRRQRQSQAEIRNRHERQEKNHELALVMLERSIQA